MIRTVRTPANGQEFETLIEGHENRPLVLFLHGFPEHAGAWADILPAFEATHLAVAPNQRGYGGSSKPAGVENYRIQALAKDMLDLAQVYSIGRPFHVVAHDWGASVGYMMAFMAPDRVATLTVLNGVHPVPFQEALINDPEQRAASQYMRFLRRDDAGKIMSENNFERVLQMLSRGFDGGAWLTEARKVGYLNAWVHPGAMDAMVSWYKATPIVVAAPGEAVAANPLATVDRDTVRVRMPHQVIWGLQDKALLPSARAGLAAFCDDLTVHEFADADHWIVHQKPAEVTALIKAFIEKHQGRVGA